MTFLSFIYCLIINSSKYNYKDNNIIISLKSYPVKIKMLHVTIYSLLNQTIKPHKKILFFVRNSNSKN